MEHWLLHLVTMKFVCSRILLNMGRRLIARNFFQSSENVPSSSIVLKSNFSGNPNDFPHDFIIRIDISSQPWALLALNVLLLKEGHFR